jgi:hypothetical protein
VTGAIYFDRELTDDQRRGDRRRPAPHSPRPATRALRESARELIAAAFTLLHPGEAHRELSVERYAQILAEVKPAFIHHPSQRLIHECRRSRLRPRAPTTRRGCVVDAGGYLTTGIAYYPIRIATPGTRRRR